MNRWGAAGVIVAVLLISFLPWIINSLFSPLQPPELVQTPTQYAPTEAAYLTRQAESNLEVTSEFFTLEPEVMLQRIGYFQEVTDVEPETATPTPTVPLPQARSVTATPAPIHVEMTEEEARTHAEQDFPDLRSPSVEIMPDSVTITGLVGGSGAVGQGITIRGTLRLEAGKIVFDATYVELNGQEITQDEIGLRAARAVNHWLRTLLVGQEIVALEAQDGLIIYEGLQFQSVSIPTPVVTVDPAQATQAALTGVPTPEDFSILPLETPTPSGAFEPDSNVPLPLVIEIDSQITLVALGTQSPDVTPPVEETVAVAAPGGALALTDTSIADGILGTLTNATVQFIPQHMTIIGTLPELPSIIPGTLPDNQVTIEVALQAHDGRLHGVIEHMAIEGLGGLPMAMVDGLEEAINGWLATQTNGLQVEQFLLEPGVLRINPEG